MTIRISRILHYNIIRNIFYSLIILLISFVNLNGQSNKLLYFEGLGNGIVYTVNYDMRFTSRQDGFGGRVGLGVVIAQNDVVITLPIMANYLLGKNGHYLELGAGGGYYRFPDSIIGDYDYDTVFGATFSIKYRWQSPKSGLMVTAGWTPMISKEISVPIYFGIGIGFTL